MGRTIKVENIEDLYISRLKENLTNAQGFGWRGWVAASQYCVNANTHLEQALEWAEIAVSKPNIDEANFTTLSNKAHVLQKMGRKTEADQAMQLAVRHRSATPIDLHQYGRQLITEKRERRKLWRYSSSTTSAMAINGRRMWDWPAATPPTAI